MACSKCGTGQVFYRREQEGVILCKKCFLDSVETKVRKTIVAKRLLEPNDKIVVALSGGKDSVALLRILWKLERRFPPARLVALTVDEGISDYRNEAVAIAKETCNELKVEHVVISFEQLYGITMDEVASGRKELQPCSYCGVLRRKALNEGARRIGATKLATAHNLDDEVQTALLNVMHGDVARISRVSSVPWKTSAKFVPRIKPLAEVPECETALYAFAAGARFQSIPCPHGGDALRGDIRTMLNRLELKHPGLKHTIYGSVGRLSEMIGSASMTRKFQACTTCGDPTPNAECEACIMLRALKTTAHATDKLEFAQVG